MADYTEAMDSWLGDGLPTDFVGTISSPKFAIPVDTQAEDPQPMLIVDIDNDEAEMNAQRIGLGKGWVAQDKGARVEKEDGGKLVFNKQSKIGRLLDSLMAQESFRTALLERAERDGAMLSPFEAAFWDGVTGTWVRNTAEFTDASGEKREYSYWTVEDATIKGAGKAKATTAKKATAKKAAASSAQSAKEKALAAKAAKEAAAEATTDAGDAGGLDLSDPTIAALVELATGADSHDDFVVAAYEIEAVLDSDELQALVDDPDGIYATARPADS